MKNKNIVLIALLLLVNLQLKAQYAYDVSQAVYTGSGENFYVGNQETAPYALAINTDGTKMFVMGSVSDAINEYNLSIAYDVSTAVYAGDTEGLSVASQETVPYALTFTPDGLKMFVMGSSSYINEYTLSSAYDVSTAVFDGDEERFYVGSQEIYPQSLIFTPDGLKMFVLGYNTDYVYQYSLFSAYDVSSAIYDGDSERFYVGSQEINPFALEFTPDGMKMYVTGTWGDDINQYTLSTAYDVSTAVYDERLYIGSEDTSPLSMVFNDDGTKLLVVGGSGDNIYEYDLVNVTPEITGTVSGQVVNNANTINLFTSVSVIDGNGGDLVSATITLDNNANGILSGTGLVGSGPYTVVSTTPADLQDILQALTFDATDNSTATTTFTIEVSDGSLTASDNTTTVTSTSNPSVRSIAVSGSPDSYATSVDFVVTFDEDVIGVDQSDFVLNVSPLATGSITSISGSGASYTVTVSGISGDGILSLDLAITGTGITDSESNPLIVGYTLEATHIVGNAYDVSQAAYTGVEENFYIGRQETNSFALVFNTDGTKMFVLGSVGDAINEYSLSIAYDVSTAIYAGDAEKFSIASQEIFPYALTFAPEGLKMFVMGLSGYINEYTLSSAYDVSTAVFDGNEERFFVGSQEIYPQSLIFTPDGLKMFVLGYNRDYIYQYSLSSAYDVSSAIYDGNTEGFYVGSQETNPYSLTFTPDGMKMYITGTSGDDITQYSLSIAYDISTAVYDGSEESLYIGGQESTPRSMVFNTDGTKMFVVGTDGDDINEYDLINVAPEIKGAVSGQVVNDGDAVINLFASVSVTDDNGGDLVSATITLDNNANGVLSGTGLIGSGPYTVVSSAPVDLQGILQTLTFDATDNSTATTTFTIEVSDGKLSTADNTTTVTTNSNPSVSTIAVSGSPDSYATSVDFIVTFDESVLGVDQSDFVLNVSPLATGSITSISGSDANYTVTVSNISGDGVLSLDLAATGTGITDAESNPVIGGFTSGAGAGHLVGNAYDVSQAMYTGAEKNFYIGTEESSPDDFAFSSDGTKMFVLGSAGDNINEYSLSTAYDVSTAVYAGDDEKFSIGSEEGNPSSFTFTPDGTKMFMMGQSSDYIHEYTLSTAYDISTAVYDGDAERFYVGSEDGMPLDMTFNADGMKIFTLGQNGRYVYQYSLSSAYDVSSARYDGNTERFYIGSQEYFPYSLTFTPDGKMMYVMGISGDDINQYRLSTAYDVSTAVYDGADEDLYVGDEETNPYSMVFNPDGTKLFVMGLSGDDINEYNLVNLAPTLVIALTDQQATEDQAFSWTMDEGSFEDPNENDILTLSSMLEGGTALPSWLTFNSESRTFSGTPSGEELTLSIIVTATDLRGLSVSDAFVLEVINVNDPHTISSISTQTVDEEREFTFTVIIEDEDLENADYVFALDVTSESKGMSVDPNGLFSWTPDELQGGTSHEVTVTVDDGEFSDSEVFTINVEETNAAPILNNIMEQTVIAGVELTFMIVGTDSDDPVQTLTYSLDATSLAKGMAINAESGVFSWTPDADQADTNHDVTVTVDDGELSDKTAFLLTVIEEDGAVLTAKDDRALLDNMNPYPNPAQSLLSLDMPEYATSYSLRIQNVDGREMHKIEIEGNSGDQTLAIDVSQYPSGWYILKIVLEDQTIQKRFIKK